jgi:hypothetical protein
MPEFLRRSIRNIGHKYARGDMRGPFPILVMLRGHAGGSPQASRAGDERCRTASRATGRRCAERELAGPTLRRSRPVPGCDRVDIRGETEVRSGQHVVDVAGGARDPDPPPGDSMSGWRPPLRAFAATGIARCAHSRCRALAADDTPAS